MNIKAFLKKPSPPKADLGRARAANNTTPEVTRLRFTSAQREKLERKAQERGVSIAQVVRDLVDGAA